MYKGGYRLFDLKDINIIPGQEKYVSGITPAFLNAYNQGKVICLNNLVIDGIEMPNVFIKPTYDENVFTIKLKNYIITISDDSFLEVSSVGKGQF